MYITIYDVHKIVDIGRWYIHNWLHLCIHNNRMAAPTLPGDSAFPYVSPGVGFPAPVPTTATDATGSFDTQTVDSKTFICVPYESRNEKYFMEGSILFTNHARTKERLLRRMVVYV